MRTFGALVGAWLLLALIHTLFAVVAARVLGGLANWDLAERLTVAAPGDDLHARLALGMVGGAEVGGIALRLPGWDALALAMPGAFASPHLLPDGAWVGPVYQAGSSAVGVHAGQLLVNVAFVALGAAAAMLVGRRSLRVGGLLTLGYGVVAQLRLSWTDDGGGQMALSMVATKVFGLDSVQYSTVIGLDWPLSLVVNTALIGVAWAAGVGTALLYFRLKSLPGAALRDRMPGMAAAALLGLLASLTPLKHGVGFQTAAETVAPPLAAALVEAAPVHRSPSVVTVHRTDGGFEYRVDGRRRRIRGIGYNAITLGESLEERPARLARDFAAMRSYGANTVAGWDQDEFDAVLLEEAAKTGLGVILPFELQASWDYGDPNVRQRLFTAIRFWVDQHKARPALRMWGLGNEVVHGMVDPESPRAQAFADFLVEAADLTHRLDPNHPVVYRDAEDQYLAPVARALARDGVPRPWFVYGMNFFTARLQEALESGPTRPLQHALMVSEFAPIGLRGADRPGGYRKIWEIIRKYPGRVLGGCAYVWSTAGPEPLDWAFGLTDDNGEPADNSIFTLAALYLRERSTE